MTRIASQSAAVAALALALGASGCMNSSRQSLQSRYTDVADPCVPERYNFQAREAALAPFAAMVTNGQILDQFLQNGDFEEGKDVLTRGGQVKLDHLARKRPVNGHLYLQTARDLAYDPAKPGDYAKAASELNAKRVEATTAYMTATTAGRNIPFDVTVIDPAEQRLPAAGPANAVRGYPNRFTSGINGITNTGLIGLGGAASAATFAPGVGGGVGAAGFGGNTVGAPVAGPTAPLPGPGQSMPSPR